MIDQSEHREVTPSCSPDPERMFPLDEPTIGRLQPTPGERRALDVCHECPILQPCRRWALQVRLPYGVVGGMTRAQRRAVSRGAAVIARSDQLNPLERVLAAQSRHEGARCADPQILVELWAGRPTPDASRWEVALAAVAMVESGWPKTRVASHLGEGPRQLYRWLSRFAEGRALVQPQPPKEPRTSDPVGVPGALPQLDSDGAA